MNNFKFFTAGTTLSVIAGAFIMGASITDSRSPAALDDKLTLEVQTLRLTKPLKIQSSDTVYLRALVGRSSTFELTPHLHLHEGQELSLKSKIVIDPSWIQNGNLEFRLELVKDNIFKNVLVRCAQVAKSVNEYNRSYECSLPGSDDSPVLVYTLRRNPSSVVAQE